MEVDLESGDTMLCNSEATLAQRACLVLCSIPCAVFVLLRYIIVGFCKIASGFINTISYWVWELFQVLGRVIYWILQRLYEFCDLTITYVLYPAWLAAKRAGMLIFEYSLFPFWNGLVLIFNSLIVPVFIFLNEWLLTPLCRILSDSCYFVCQYIMRPVCCQFLPEVFQLLYTYVCSPVYDAVDAIAKFMWSYVILPIGRILEVIWQCLLPLYEVMVCLLTPIADMFVTVFTVVWRGCAYVCEWVYDHVLLPLWMVIDHFINAMNHLVVLPLLRCLKIPFPTSQSNNNNNNNNTSSEATPLTLTTVRGTRLTLAPPVYTPVVIPIQEFYNSIQAS
jgi:hypothetical protein